MVITARWWYLILYEQLRESQPASVLNCSQKILAITRKIRRGIPKKATATKPVLFQALVFRDAMLFIIAHA